MFRFKFKTVILIVFLILTVGWQVMAEETPYLKYQDPNQQMNSPSWMSTGSYVLSLLITFLVVLGLAYFTSRIMGQKMRFSAGSSGGKIISTLSFGSGRGIYVIEIAGKYLILGVTDQNIHLLREISDSEEIEKLKEFQGGQISKFTAGYAEPNESFNAVFERQLASLKQMSQKFPAVLKTENDNNSENNSETNVFKQQKKT